MTPVTRDPEISNVVQKNGLSWESEQQGRESGKGDRTAVRQAGLPVTYLKTEAEGSRYLGGEHLRAQVPAHWERDRAALQLQGGV